MHRARTTISIRTGGWRATLLATLGAGVFVLPGVSAGVAHAESVWLCKPGAVANPCESSEETTVELGSGSTSVEDPQPASNPPIDCFYVYPTVSSQSTVNANYEVGAEEKQVAIDQASRFSQQCKVYAPIYPQLTLNAIKHPEEITTGDRATAYLGVQFAFNEYMSKYNDGRGFVLIGHSQGALMLKQLIKEEIDPNAELRKHLVSAMIFGGNVLVPKGGTVGAEFQNIPACESAGQTHCVVAYSSFLNKPPAGSFFGRVSSPLLGTATKEEEEKDEVLCVNPALSVQGEEAGALERYESTTQIPGFEFPAPSAPTPWVSMPGQYTGQCEHSEGATWLQLTDVGPSEDKREQIAEVLGPEWGTHLNDVNVALGNLVGMTALEAATYAAEQLVPVTPAPTPSPPPPSSSATTSGAPAPTVLATPPKRAVSHKTCKPKPRRRRGSHRRVMCPKPKPHKHKHKHKPLAHKHKR